MIIGYRNEEEIFDDDNVVVVVVVVFDDDEDDKEIDECESEGWRMDWMNGWLS